MSRVELIARGLLILALGCGVVAIAALGVKAVFKKSDAPSVDELRALERYAYVAYEHTRTDITPDHESRSVLVAVPGAKNQETARRGVLVLLERAGWTVNRRGGAIRSDGKFCLTVRPPVSWLHDPVNKALRKDVEKRFKELGRVAVVVDLFYC
jgi:hypothetical protein